MHMRRLAARLSPILAAGALLLPRCAVAQTPQVPGEPDSLVDRVVAVVGDSVILMSQLQEQAAILEQQGQTFPTDPDQRRQAFSELLNSLVDLQLVLQAAALDSTLTPDDAVVNQRVEQAVQQVQSQFGTTQALQQALDQDGLTLATYREELRRQIRTQQIQQLYMQRQLQQMPAVAVTEAEMRELFESQKDQLQQRPEFLSLEQVILRPSPPDSSWAAAKRVADSLVVALRAGADFAATAEEMSDDPGSAANGGDLGWFRRGNFIQAFEDAAFRLSDGQISNPVRTDYGWHIIKVERSRPGEVKARHILITPEPSPEDAARARALASSLADSIRAGASAEDLNQRYGESRQSAVFTIPRDSIATDLPPGYADALRTAQEGDVVGPFETTINGQTFFVVVKVSDIREAGEFQFDDLKDTIRQRLQQQKQINRIYDQLRERAYVDIRF